MLKMDQVHVLRHTVLKEGQSIRRVARELGLSRNTVAKYLDQPEPIRSSRQPRERPVWEAVQPRLRQSGKKRFSGSPTIPFGNARLRKALWMVVLNAVRCNPWLRQYYGRLRAAGKPGKVAVIAAMRKLLAAVWSVATHRRPFVPHLPPIPSTPSAVTNSG